MKYKIKKAILLMATAGVMAGNITACGGDSQNETNSTQETVSENTGNDAADSAAISGSTWTSANGAVTINVPDDTWSAETDTENSITLRADAGTINIVRYEGADMLAMMVPTTEADYQSMVSGGSGDTAIEVVEYSYKVEGNTTIYQGVMHYNNEENPYRYLIHYGIYDEQGGYTATGIVNSNDEAVMETIKESVYSMNVTGE